jgi:hypothetical protein
MDNKKAKMIIKKVNIFLYNIFIINDGNKNMTYKIFLW